MELLKERILRDGYVKDGDVLQVDSFLNHQLDVPLLCEIGAEFRRRFAEETVTTLLTIEASGLGIAVAAAPHFGNVPVLFAKKSKYRNLDGERYTTQVKSFTKGQVYDVQVAKKYLTPQDRVCLLYTSCTCCRWWPTCVPACRTPARPCWARW